MESIKSNPLFLTNQNQLVMEIDDNIFYLLDSKPEILIDDDNLKIEINGRINYKKTLVLIKYKDILESTIFMYKNNLYIKHRDTYFKLNHTSISPITDDDIVEVIDCIVTLYD